MGSGVGPRSASVGASSELVGEVRSKWLKPAASEAQGNSRNRQPAQAFGLRRLRVRQSVVLQSAINISEGRDDEVLRALEAEVRSTLVDRHSDMSHHRSVFTLLGSDEAVLADAKRLTESALSLIDLRNHIGVHPRFGVVDVVPFIPFVEGRNRTTPVDFSGALEAAAHYRAFAKALGLATAPYGLSNLALPEVRKQLRTGNLVGLVEDSVNPQQGVTIVGVRDVLVAWNMWINGSKLEVLREVAANLRSPALRTLALELGGGQLQLSCNVVLPFEISLSQIVQATRECLESRGQVTGGELVGLLPKDLLTRSPSDEWEFLGISEERTLEWKYQKNLM